MIFLSRGDGFTGSLPDQYVGVLVDIRSMNVTVFQGFLGLRTVYYSQIGSNLIVSARLDRLRNRMTMLAVDKAYFAEFMQTGVRPAAATPFANVFKLTGGTTVTYLQGRTRTIRPRQRP